MRAESAEPVVKLLVTIMDRGKGERVVDFYRSRGLPYHFITLGFGTANSQILDYFGLNETEKDIVLTLVQGDHSRRLLEDTTNDFRMTGPGRGILFTLPLSGVSGRVPQILEHIKEKEAAGMEEKREPTMEEEGKKVPFDLVLTVVERGNVDAVMQAASKAGARGGTVLHARRVLPGLHHPAGEGNRGDSGPPYHEAQAYAGDQRGGGDKNRQPRAADEPAGGGYHGPVRLWADQKNGAGQASDDF